MSVAAFHLGLKNRLYQLDELLEQDHVIYHHGYNAAELRKMFNYRKLPSFVDEDALYELLEKVLDLAKEGLKERGLGEEIFLESLYDRMQNQTNPARKMLELREQGAGLEEIIWDYAALE